MALLPLVLFCFLVCLFFSDAPAQTNMITFIRLSNFLYKHSTIASDWGRAPQSLYILKVQNQGCCPVDSNIQAVQWKEQVRFESWGEMQK